MSLTQQFIINFNFFNMEQEPHKIKVVTKKVYTIFQKLFCCMCFDCLRGDDQSMLTSQIRKQTFQRMIKNFVLEHDLAPHSHLFDPLKLMIIIYLCEDKNIPHKLIQRCRINPDLTLKTKNRTDLQFYIPQICNFLVFHQDLKNIHLLDDMLAACKVNYYFAHLFYFYINSLEKIVNKNQTIVINQVSKYKQSLLQILSKQYYTKMLFVNDVYMIHTNKLPAPGKQAVYENIKKYGTIQQDQCHKQILIEAQDILLPNYVSIYSNEVEQLESFKSTINFFEDLFLIAEDIKKADPKSKALKHLLRKVNEKLPACVYVPFAKNGLRLNNVLNIVVQESKVFSTKQRAPFYICIEIFKPTQVLTQQLAKKIDKQIAKPVILKNKVKTSSDNNLQKMDNMQISFSKKKSTEMKSELLSEYRQSLNTEIIQTPKEGKLLTNKLIEFRDTIQNKMNRQSRKQIQLNQNINSAEYSKKLGKIFGETLQKINQRIKAKSIYSHLKTWDLVHLMVKTGDNLKQEQFALQLIYQFHYIFKLESLPLILTPYEIISMGPDNGVMQMIKDSVTIDGLLKKLKQDHPNIKSLKQFFEAFYYDNLHKAKQNFMKSLAAYSLVMYFLQVKDRHNGNILFHRDGRIIHIDFGFLLSNAPGKGVQLQKSAPFKLNTQYIQVLDGTKSSYFQDFRKYFYLGFQAARKHQDRILILVKMMFSSSGSTMPCFQKGQIAIKQLQARFNPPQIINDLQLSEHCQKLINLSLDNWATTWYDKWQYWAQGIFY